MPRMRWRRLTLPLVLTLVAVACTAGGTQDPKDQLVDALRAMSRDAGVTLVASVDTDEASLARMAETTGESLPPEAARLLQGGSLRVSVPFDPEAKSMAFALRTDAGDVLELRVVDDVLYLRADVPALLEAAGQDPAMADGIRGMLAQVPMVPADVVDGRWISLAGVTGLAERMSGAPVDNPLDQVEARAAMERFAKVLTESASVTRVGTDADGDHLRATVPLRAVYEAWLAEAEALGLSDAAATQMPSAEAVPDQTMTVDLWLRDGRLAVLAVDASELARLDDGGPRIPEDVRLALRVEFEAFDGTVEAPADAVTLDPNAILGMLMGGMGAAFGSSMSGMAPSGMPPSGMPPGMPPGAMAPGMPPGAMPPGMAPPGS